MNRSRGILVIEFEGGRTVEIDLNRPLDFDIDEHIDNDAARFPATHPRAHPVTRAEIERLAALLGIDATSQFRLELHVAVVSTLQILLRGGFPGPRRLRALLNRLDRDPEYVPPRDAVADLVVRTLGAASDRSRFGAGIRSMREMLRGAIRRGEPGDEVRALFFEALTQIAHDFGDDLRLPQRDDSRGGVSTTPFLEFVRAAIELLIARGRMVEGMPACKLTDYEHLTRAALIKALEKTRATILQEAPIPWALP
jgi:hypothetical protein